LAKKDTLIYIEVPLDRKKNKRYWHEHINFFTLESLRILCKSVGLDIIWIDEVEFINHGREIKTISVIAKKQ
jgi:hypothetical protein